MYIDTLLLHVSIKLRLNFFLLQFNVSDWYGWHDSPVEVYGQPHADMTCTTSDQVCIF